MNNSLLFRPNILSASTAPMAPLTTSTLPTTVVSQPLLSSTVSPVVTSPLVTSTVQPLVTPAPVVTTTPVVTPAPVVTTSPVVTSTVQPLVTPAPVVTSTVSPLVTSVAPTVPMVTPSVAPLGTIASSQLVPTPLLVSPYPKPLTPSPSYEKFIPPTPSTTTLSATNTPTIYQFYHYAPATTGPAYSTITTPLTGVQNPLILPQYGTLSLY